MLALTKGGYTKDQVISRLHYKKGGRKVSYRYDLLNKYDVKIGELKAQLGGSITLNSLAQIKRTGNFAFAENELSDVDWLNDRIRPIYILEMPDGGKLEWALGTFLLSSPSRKYQNYVARDVEAYDANVVLTEDKFDNRYWIQAGTGYIAAITDILNSAGIWKINIMPHAGILTVDKEFEIGTSKLTAINQLLSEINYTSLWIDETGYAIAKPYILPTDREAEYEYGTDEISIMRPDVTNEIDLFNIPNVWVVTASNPEKDPLVSRYTNDSSTSKTSTVSRNRRIVDFREIDDIYDQATLDAYVQRIAYESSQVYDRFVFNTAAMPHHTYSDILQIEHSELGVSDKYVETSWTLNLSLGGLQSHECRRVITI
jgi:hypothetical protein